MNCLRHAAPSAALIAIATACLTSAAGRFDQKLPVDKQAIHVLNRLTFGPRPGDIEQVRRIGVDKWIDQQLHPDQISESPVLENKLKPLGTLQLATWQIAEKYPQAPAALMIRPPAISTLPPQITSRLFNGSVEERRSTLASLDPEMR